MKRLTARHFQFVAIALLVGACGYMHEKDTGGEPPQSSLESGGLSYARINERVLIPRCVSCHGNSGGLSLESYASVKAAISEIEERALRDRDMPPRSSGALTQAEASLLSEWIAAGAPEFATKTPSSAAEPAPSAEQPRPLPTPAPSPGPSTSPSPAPAPAPSPSPSPQPELPQPYFQSLYRTVFKPRCLRCHSGDSPDGDVSFESLDALKRSPRVPLRMEEPGDPDSSGLLLVLTSDDEERKMPPPPRKPLQDFELDAIRTWLKAGAPDSPTR